jgi:hypothetical protein
MEHRLLGVHRPSETGAVDRRPQWDDEVDDWNRPRRRLQPDPMPRATSRWKPSVVTWMYVIFGALILAQVLRFHLAGETRP